MRLLGLAIAAAGLAACPEASLAEVRSSSPIHFDIESRVTVAAAPAEAFAALGRIGAWWDPEHTYSGDSANLRLDLHAGGCFCEAIPGGGSIEHMRIIYARPGQVLRLQGGLGPLQEEAVAGTLTWTLRPVDGGTEIVSVYLVSGHVRGDVSAYAAPVDAVMREQLSRLRTHLAR